MYMQHNHMKIIILSMCTEKSWPNVLRADILISQSLEVDCDTW